MEKTNIFHILFYSPCLLLLKPDILSSVTFFVLFPTATNFPQLSLPLPKYCLSVLLLLFQIIQKTVCEDESSFMNLLMNLTVRPAELRCALQILKIMAMHTPNWSQASFKVQPCLFQVFLALLAFCMLPRFLSSPSFTTFLIFDPNIYPGFPTDGEDTEQSSGVLFGEKEEAQ